jgi:hypothetical protein
MCGLGTAQVACEKANSFAAPGLVGLRRAEALMLSPKWDAVVLMFRSRSAGDGPWHNVNQRVPIVWTGCRSGGRRPWFLYACGRRVAKLHYGVCTVFTWRQCSGLVYASQQESPWSRAVSRAQKIRIRLGGGA